ncbi:MAG: hypothetical protein M1457_03500, partial [bacterium]|nr:hypothetical protein [bacterium]
MASHARRSTTPSTPALLWTVHFAFVATIPIYALVADFLIVPSIAAPPALPVPQVLILVALGFVSMVNIIVGLNWERLVTSHAPADEHPSEVYLDKVRVLMIISDAAFESIAVFGLAGFVLGFTRLEAYSFLGWSSLLW